MGVLIYKDNKFTEYDFKREDELETLVKEKSKSLFGLSTIYIDLKSRISASSLGESIPDGFLFDLGDINDPAFYKETPLNTRQLAGGMKVARCKARQTLAKVIR